MLFTTEQILEAKAPSIYAFLLSKGFAPDIDKSNYAMFKSPFRSERTASFKVDKNENIFFDHGTGEYGDFIQLFQNFTGTNFKEAVTQILANSFSFQCQSNQHDPITGKPAPEMALHRVKPLENKALIDYLKSRRIDIGTAQAYCQEVYYYANGKHYFAIGFQNDSRGYELRNKYFKGCIGKKDITFLKIAESNKLAIFEGFFDFLAAIEFWELKGKMFECDAIILNSITQLSKALPYLKDYEKVYTFFDNDRAGQQANATLSQSYTIHECNALYANWKDIAEFWEKEDEAY